MKTFTAMVFGVLLCSSFALADGLIIPASKQYPKDFLRNRLTSVTVDIHGAVAETIVYQEFVNEWDRAVDGVYCFPLPADARATAIYYWRHDTLFQAVLRVREQSTTPGTGDGGAAASVNSYIGANGIKLELKGMPANAIQKVRIHYIQALDYGEGEYAYRFPLSAKDFIQYPREQVTISLNVSASADIKSFRMPTHPGYRLVRWEPRSLELTVDREKVYATADFEFRYTVDAGAMWADFSSTANDTMEGHYAMFIHSPAEAVADSILPRRFLFLLGNSNTMAGVPFEQGRNAILRMLDLLKPEDEFNVMTFDSRTASFDSAPVPADPANLAAARLWISAVRSGSGSRLDLALPLALAQFADQSRNNAILAFTDGRSPIDPRDIARRNEQKIGIFLVGIGDDLERSRMEMTAELNYGFVRYFRVDENLSSGMERLIRTIDRPLLKNVSLFFEMGSPVYDVRPLTFPSVFAGSCLMTAGRYRKSGPAVMTLVGRSRLSWSGYDFPIDFDSTKRGGRRSEILWAKMTLDAVEREIDVEGERPELKDSAIAISLRYGIRCRYTAYIADYKPVIDPTDVSSDPGRSVPASCLLGNYPNPFNPSTTIHFRISAASLAKGPRLFRIYDLAGRLVAEIDVSAFDQGEHAVIFDGRDLSGRLLPSGAYMVRLITGEGVSVLKILLVK